MIQLAHFKLSETKEANDFLKKHGVKNQQGFHINTEGIFVFFEDGEYTDVNRKSMLYEKLMSAKNALFALQPDYEMYRMQIEKITTDIEAMEKEKKEKAEPMMGWKAFNSMLDNAKNQLNNAQIQILQTKASMDKSQLEIDVTEGIIKSL